MDPLYLKAILAGLCFGLWPLFMNKSGLNSVEASAALSLFLLRWQMVLPACLFDALGLLALNSLLSSASSAQAGSAFVIVTVVQVAVPAAYLAMLAGGLTPRSGIGLVAAAIAVYLLR